MKSPAPSLLALLQQIEWNGEFGDCPKCGEGGTPQTGIHRDGCELNAMIKLLDAPPLQGADPGQPAAGLDPKEYLLSAISCIHAGRGVKAISLIEKAVVSDPSRGLAAFDLHSHLARQAAWSERTFGPGSRAKGVVDHIRKELAEIEADPGDLKEWIDVVILALDGAWRSGASPSEIISALVAKQAKNESRTWPDWRTADPNKAIEHDRSGDPVPAAPAAPVEKQPAIVSQYGRVHFLKCHPKPFAALKDEIKGFEYRSFDRDYQVGDLLMLQEWDPETAEYTGIGLFRRVTYLISEGFGIPPGYCIMSVIPAHPGSVSTGLTKVDLPSDPHHGEAARIYSAIPTTGESIGAAPLANRVARDLFSYAYGLETEIGRLRAGRGRGEEGAGHEVQAP